jgi:hyperosmotically inducible periplasmic protein
MKARTTIVGILIALVWLPGALLAQDWPDLRVAEDIARQVNTYPRFTIFDDVSIEVESGLVTLTGKVTMPYKREDIGKRAARVSGVREVRNQIDVLPVSSFDDELRYRIARAIYGSPSFWNYAAMANPPIHIIVERGRVTLTGVVNSNVERMLARSLATGWGELSVTNDLRTDAEVRVE